MPMDAQLAEIYGTPSNGDDLEKVASVELLVKIAEENGINIDDLSDEDLESVLSEIQGGGGEPEGSVKVAHATDGNLYIFDENGQAIEKLDGEVKVAQAQDGSLWVVDDEGQAVCPFEGQVEGQVEGQDDPAFQEKVAESDFLGRVMAHAYEQEKREIEKAAQYGPAGVAGKGAKKALQWLAGRPARYRQAGRELKQAVGGVRTVPGDIVPEAMTKTERLKALARAGKKVLPETVVAGGAAGGGIYAGTRGKKKKASAEMVGERAYEILKQAGWVDTNGDVIPPQEEKVASAEELEVAALQRLEELGYPVEWNR
jgi:hypothetical protein